MTTANNFLDADVLFPCKKNHATFQALRLDPRHGKALRSLAGVYQKAGLPEKAFDAAKVRL